MNKQIKVTKEAISIFKDEVCSLLSVAEPLKQRVDDFESVINLVSVVSNRIDEKLVEVNETIDLVCEKQRETQADIANLESKLDYLEDKLEGIRSAMYDCDYDSPGYAELEAAEERTERKIEDTETRIEKKNNRLDRLVDVNDRLNKQLGEITKAREKASVAKEKSLKAKISFESATNLSLEKSNNANRLLEKAVDQISKYLSIKINVDNKIHIDDNGRIYRVDDSVKRNTTFTKNGFTFHTDNQGRTVSVSGKLKLADKSPRKLDDMKKVGKGDEKDTDDRGHLIARRFGGPDTLENLVPQDHKINTVDYKDFEDKLAKLLSDGKEIYVEVRTCYPKDSRRPNALCVIYSVDGVTHIRTFPNEKEENA